VGAAATPLPREAVEWELVFELRPAASQDLDSTTLIELRALLRQQLALLGVNGLVSRRQDGRIVVRVDASSDPEGVAQSLTTTPLLEIIDTQEQYLPLDTVVHTWLTSTTAAVGEVASPVTADAGGSEGSIFTTIVSGADFSDVSLQDDPATGQPIIAFSLDEAAARRFSDYTGTHIGQPMAIVLDKRVISSPTIVAAIKDEGIIAGVSPDEAPLLAAQLQFATLGVPLMLVERRLLPPGIEAATPNAA
jgi:preprotein translocase subunit SecD